MHNNSSKEFIENTILVMKRVMVEIEYPGYENKAWLEERSNPFQNGTFAENSLNNLRIQKIATKKKNRDIQDIKKDSLI
ncbi:hypothetical protein BpHYR1_030680 [Brachionus plicatilis]|uniref:Uncharacterized protein n=1 Tax=Brachionus plicatilis TaxID=10195 RepID=A0A3M7R7Z3_BRAPC|nr:hypothetical protein BpHYR1_030680 [Brachionus plicatilis]